MSRFQFRQLFTPEGTVTGGYVGAAATGKKPLPPFAITKGSQPHMIVKHILANPKSTIPELAAEFVRKNGEKGLKVNSFESTLSKIVSYLKKKNKFDGTQFKASLPTDYNQGGQGTRRRAPLLEGDALDDLVGQAEESADDEGDEGDEAEIE